METQAATPTGAEASARADTSTPSAPLSVKDRLKAYLTPSEEAPVKPAQNAVAKAEQAAPAASDEPIAEAAEVAEEKADDAAPPAVEEVETAEDEPAPVEVKDLKSLSDATGLDLDKLMDLDIPTKIDGKTGSARLRDLIKSYQLEGHLNQKSMTHAETVKAFEAEASRRAGEIKTRVEQLNQAAVLAQKILEGEFADVNWQELQRTDPAAFQAQYGAYKMRQDGISQLSNQVMQEQERVNATQKAAQEAYLAEQAKLLDSKVPEWADKGKRDKDVTEMVATLRDAYGLTEEEVRSTSDHRLILIARDAANWQKLQKSKPATLQKVKAAPKLLKPGTQQSRAAQDNFIAQKERERLRSSGKVSDAKAVLKRALFNN